MMIMMIPLLLLALVIAVYLVLRRVIAAFLYRTWSALSLRTGLSNEVMGLVVAGIPLYILLGYALLVLSAVLPSPLPLESAAAVFMILLLMPLCVVLLGGFMVLSFRAVGEYGRLLVIAIIPLFILLAPLVEAASECREVSPAHLTTAASVTVVLLIFNGAIVFIKNTSPGGRVRRALLLVPYTVYPSFWALFLGLSTGYYMSAPTKSGLMKIYVGLFNLIYVVGLIALPTGIALLLSGEKRVKEALTEL